MEKKSAIKVGIVGATGLVGFEMRKLLYPTLSSGHYEIFLFASQERSADGILSLQKAKNELSQCQFILNAASNDVAFELKDGLLPHQFLIDNSSAFRMDPEVPLVVPEVNGNLLQSKPAIVANPNCTTILLTVALQPLLEAGLQRVVISTYQAASGAGLKGLEELEAHLKASALGLPLPKSEIFPFSLAGNVMSHNTPIRGEEQVGAGYNEEEWKVIEETKKILNHGHLPVTATCLRVPVRRAHTEAVTVDLKEDWSVSKIRDAFSKARGIKLVDEPEKNHFPMPSEAENQDLVLVGRIRKDTTLPRTLHFLLSGDQIRKGAATNAIQIMQRLEAATAL